MDIQKVSLSSEGQEFSGELALPEGSGKGPAVVVVQEWWGLNDHIRSLLRRLASAGFVAIAPDLYHGKTTRDPDEASRLMTELDTLRAVREIGAAAAFARAHARSNGHVGVMGFCLGGALTLASACHLEQIGAAVAFYGIPPADKVDYARVTAPVLMHVARRDQWVTVEKATQVKEQIEKAGKASVRLDVYDADHAFCNDTRPDVFHAEAASIAWTRSLDLLRQQLR